MIGISNLLRFMTKTSHSILLKYAVSGCVSASERDQKLKVHLADKVNLFLYGAEWAKPQVIMGIMEHAAVWVSHVLLIYYTITHRQVVQLKEKKRKEMTKCS